MKEFAEVLKSHFPDLTTVEQPQEVFRPKRGALDIQKAKSILGFEPEYSLEAGLEKYVAFVRSLAETDSGTKEPVVA